MRHAFFASTALLACLTLPSLAADAPAAAPATPPAPAAVAAPTAAAETETAPVAELGVASSIIRLVVESKTPSIVKPWQMEKTDPRVATGVIVTAANGKNYILTSANNVSFATKIQVDADKTEAVVFAHSPAMQLALLEIKDAAKSAEFFKKHRPLELTNWPSTIAIVGCTANEKGLEVLEGLVAESRIDAYGNQTGIRSVAKLSPPSAGIPQAAYGPVINDGKLTGFFQTLQQSEDKKSIFALFTPAVEIKTFVEDAADGRYDGKWSLKKPLNLQPLVNEALRAKLGLKPETKGLLVNGAAEEIAPFKPQDVLTSIGSHTLDNMGATAIEGQFPGSALYYLNAAANAETKTIKVTVLRDGKSIQLDVPAARREAEWMPSLVAENKAPRYFVFGPMCFQQATSELAQALVKQRGLELTLSGNPIGSHLQDNALQTPGEEIVVLSHLFPKNAASAGYPGANFAAVKTVNGQAITSLKQLAKVLTECKDEFLTIQFHDKDAATLVFKRADMEKATKDVREDQQILNPCSPDLADVLKY